MVDTNPQRSRPDRQARRSPRRQNATPSRGLKNPRRVGRWVILAALWLMGIPIWVGFFVLTAAFLAPVFGVGWPWIGASLVFCLGLPIVVGAWLVRPLQGFKKAAWFTGVFVILPLLVVLGLSTGLPGTTGPRLRNHGKVLFEQLFGPVTRSRLSRGGTDLVTRWADVVHRSTRLGHPAKPAVPSQGHGGTPRPAPRTTKRELHFAGMRQAQMGGFQGAQAKGPRSRVPYVRRGGALMLRAEAFGSRPAPMKLVLDPDAPLSAVTHETARKLGLQIPAHPVQVELDTAGGRQHFALSVLRRLRIGGAVLEHVTVAICDACVPSGLSGRLGFNFTRHFAMSADPKRGQLTLQAHRGPRNRVHDVDSYLELVSESGNIVGARFATEGQIRNRGPRTILQLRLTAELLDTQDRVLHSYDTVVPRLTPGQTLPFLIQGEAQEAVVKYRLEPSAALW